MGIIEKQDNSEYSELYWAFFRIIEVKSKDEQTALSSAQALYQNEGIMLGAEHYQSMEFEILE